jgi:hypothetical protein
MWQVCATQAGSPLGPAPNKYHAPAVEWDTASAIAAALNNLDTVCGIARLVWTFRFGSVFHIHADQMMLWKGFPDFDGIRDLSVPSKIDDFLNIPMPFLFTDPLGHRIDSPRAWRSP